MIPQIQSVVGLGLPLKTTIKRSNNIMSETSEKLEEIIDKIYELSEQVENMESQLCNIPILELDDIENLMEKVLRKNKKLDKPASGTKVLQRHPLRVRTK
jgi:hypothetical protein